MMVVLCLIGTYYPIAPGITLADYICVPLFIVSCYKILLKRWGFDIFFKLTSIYIICMLLSALFNGNLFNTTFINFFRNYTYGSIIYLVTVNCLKSYKDIKVLLFFFLAYVLVFLFNYQTMMQDSFSQDLAHIDFGYGRNNVAFTAMLLAIFCEFLFYSKLLKSYIVLLIPLMLLIMVSCASRFAFIMFVTSFIVYRIFAKTGFSKRELFTIVLLMLVTPFVSSLLMNYIDSSFLSSSSEYLTEKVNNADDDFIHLRIFAINLIPIEKFYNENGLGHLLLGDGVSIQHSWFSHTFITTGIVGLICYIKTNIELILWSFKYKGVGLFLFIFITAMISNDFITNARFIVNVNSMLYALLCAIIYKYIELNENNISRSISC